MTSVFVRELNGRGIRYVNSILLPSLFEKNVEQRGFAFDKRVQCYTGLISKMVWENSKYLNLIPVRYVVCNY